MAGRGVAARRRLRRGSPKVGCEMVHSAIRLMATLIRAAYRPPTYVGFARACSSTGCRIPSRRPMVMWLPV